MKRRDFLRTTALTAAAIATHNMRAQDAITATLTIDESTKLATIPPDYIGLSYESAQLANPAFFSATNKSLIAIFRDLGKQGVLRIGGGTSEFTAFTLTPQTGPPPFDAVGPDTSKNVKSDTPITPLAIENLRRFLDATGWRCLYGLNLGRGKAADAAIEVQHIQQILGSKLIAFQLGNEPDAWRNRYRPAAFTYDDYWKEWQAAHAAIIATTPNAKFAGPDISNKMPYVTGFAADVKKTAQTDVVMLTSHYYAMGPAGAKDVTMDKLLSPDSKLRRDLKIAVDAAKSIGVPYRMDEGNSCWNGGQEGVSDTLASALWAADMMLDFASGGCAGVNLHGGGNGFYTPIAGSLATGFTTRPEYLGMQLAKEFVGATLLATKLDSQSDKLSAYAAIKDGAHILLAINKTDQPATLKVPLQQAKSQAFLTGSALDQKSGVTLTKSKPTALHNGILTVAPHSAVFIRET